MPERSGWQRNAGAFLCVLLSIGFLLGSVVLANDVRSSRNPATVSCQKFMAGERPSTWLHLTDCKVDVFSQSYLMKQDKTLVYLLFALRAPNDESHAPSALALAVATPDLVTLANAKLAEKFFAEAGKRYEAALEAGVYSRTEWTGVPWDRLKHQTGTREAIADANDAISRDAQIFLVDTPKPTAGPAAGFLAGCLAFAALAVWVVRGKDTIRT